MNTDECTPSSPNGIGSQASSAARNDKLFSFGMLLICCALLTALRCRELFTGKGSTACALVTVCSVVIMLLLSIRSRLFLRPALRYGMLSVTFGASVSACLLLIATGFSVYYAYFVASPIVDANFAVSLLAKVSALFSAVSFVVTSATASLEKKKSLHLLLTIPPIFYCAMRVLNSFINSSTLPLAVTGGYRILGLIAAMLFFLNEGKILLGVKSSLAYQFTGYTAAIFCAAYDLPTLVCGVRNGGFGPDAAYSLLSLGLVAYILTRIATLPAREEADAE